jgi:hypothetical protein
MSIITWTYLLVSIYLNVLFVQDNKYRLVGRYSPTNFHFVGNKKKGVFAQ